MLVANREIVSNTIITCFVLHNFCYIKGEAYLEEDILYESKIQDRILHRRRYHNKNDVSQNRKWMKTISKKYMN